MARSVRSLLDDSGVLKHVILPPDLDLMMSALELTGEPAPDPAGATGIVTGDVRLKKDLSKSPIPGFDFALSVPTDVVDAAPYKLRFDPPVNPTSFQFWLVLARQGQVLFAFTFVEGLPGLALTGAERQVGADGSVSLVALPAGDPKRSPVLVSRSPEAGAALGPALLIAARKDQVASLRFTPDTDSTSGLVALGLEPQAVVFGTSGLGFECPAFIIDDSEDAGAEGQGVPTLDPPLATIPADTPAWRGLLARQLDFYLPANVPLIGGHPLRGYLAVARGAGAELVIETQVPSRPAAPGQPARLGYGVRIECLDPAARGLSSVVPTLITVTVELPLDGAGARFNEEGGAGREITFAAGKPVRVTATLARDLVNAPGEFRLAVSVSAQGPEGILSVTSRGMGGAKIFTTAAALATALIADKDVERKADVGDTKGVVLAGLLAAGAALSSLFTDDGRFVLHGAEIESTGHGAPLGGPLALTLDYSVAVRVTRIDVGVLSVSMSPDQPMRIRVRKVRMSIDPGKSGLDMIGLDFGRSQMEIENPGAWNVEGLDSLFDVLGSRSGRGSSWLEVDLRFKLNLGPIRVSGATIRATLNEDGSIDASIRGLDVGLTIPGALDGSGRLQLLAKGFAAELRAKLLPLNVAADAGIIYAPPMIVLRLSVDLPAPIPLANTGFGLFGLGGLFGLSAQPDYGAAADPDPVLRQLKWTPDKIDSFKPAPDQATFGLSAAVGTLPDLGFSFSAKAGVLITVPDLAVRGALNGRVFQPAVKMTDPSFPPGKGISFLGFVGIDREALSFGVLGAVNLLPLLEIRVPLAGYFPFTETDNWYVYLGADGAPTQGRSIGPISASILPGILDVHADAYVMLRGRGIENWPHGRALPGGPLTLKDGFVAAFGFGVQYTYGLEPVVWAELYASLDLLVGVSPPTLAGFGRAGGSLNLGPFSLGVEAQVAFLVSGEATYFWAEVTGRIELFFFDIEGTVTIAFGEEPKLVLPPPDRHPLDRLTPDGKRAGALGTLFDDSYRVITPLAERPDELTDDRLVWPDVLISLPFAVMPELKGPGAFPQFPGIETSGTRSPPASIGTEMLWYRWRLDALALADVTDEADALTGAGTPPAGQFAASWQLPRSGSAEVSELVLFSMSKDLWVNRLADGGEGLPDSPLKQTAELCQRQIRAVAGWAVGDRASQQQRGFRLPPESLSVSPWVSRVEVHLRHTGLTGRGLPVDLPRTLPAPYSVEPARRVAWPAPQEIKHLFSGYLAAPNLRWLAGLNADPQLLQGPAISRQQLQLDLVEAVVDGLLIVVADPAVLAQQEGLSGLHVVDDRGQVWGPPDLLPLPGGETASLFHAPGPDPVQRLTLSYPLGTPLGVVGIGGVTVGAQSAATAANVAAAQDAAQQAAAAAAGPKVDPTTNVAHQRSVLRPGRLYRLKIDLSWSGRLSKQDESGKVIAVDERTDIIDAANSRTYFFRTAPKAVAPPPVRYGQKDFLYGLRRRLDVFHPDMLERFVAGYDPAQSVEFFLCDDPLRAHFLQDHVAALAGSYGFGLKVAVRRVDRPGPAYADALLVDPHLTFATDASFLGEVDQLRVSYAAASPCAVPTPGATATVTVPLEPEALYEVYVLAKAADPAFADGRLPGVTFRTSRWRTPADLFSGLGLAVPGGPGAAPVLTGDLAISALPGLMPAVLESEDQPFQDALQVLGLEGWPAAETSRLSRLWVPAGVTGWLFAGLLIESPEPVHRPGRLEVEGLTLSMGRAGRSVRFDQRRRDRSGSRLLYLTSAPFRVITREPVAGRGGPLDPPPDGLRPRFRTITPQLTLSAQSRLSGAITPLSGLLTLPPAPAFSEEPS